EDQLDDEEKDDKEGDANDEADDHISYTKDTKDEYDETESDEDEIYKYRMRVHKYKDEDMLNDEVEDSDKGDEEKSRGKGSQRKNIADDPQETVDVSEEYEPEPELVKRKTDSRSVVKKIVIIFADDNIIFYDPDVSLDLVDLEQESEKSPSEIRKIKKEQAEKQKMWMFTIKSIDKAALKEFDQKSTLCHTFHANKSFNKIPANHIFYHAFMEALIED
nr:hypothetical protein [Tanacetum cinerariifolium]GFC06691.1 hypothetical protein [Tanacetum cinerariifolium]